MSYITQQLYTSLLLATFLMALLVPGRAQGVSPDTSVKLSVTPAIIDLPFTEGVSVVTSRLRLQNLSGSSVPVSFSAFSVVIEGESLEDSSEVDYDVSSWIDFEKDVVLFEPSETKKIEFTVTVPEGAKPGGHYASINIRGLGLERPTEGRQTTVIFPEISVPVLVTVPGDTIKDIRLAEANIFPAQVTPLGQVESVFFVENHGSTHELVSPSIVVFKSGHESQRVIVDPSIVLPGTRKEFRLDWEFTDSYGIHEAAIDLSDESNPEDGSREVIYSTWSLPKMFTTSVATVMLLHLLRRRKNIIPALTALLSKQKPKTVSK